MQRDAAIGNNGSINMDIKAILKSFLDERNRLTAFPAKRKMKIYALFYLSTKFEPHRTYTEKEFNEILDQWHVFHDPATLRRELYNNRFIDRESDGRSYWLENEQPTVAELEKKLI
jgi:hypothetical protein